MKTDISLYQEATVSWLSRGWTGHSTAVAPDKDRVADSGMPPISSATFCAPLADFTFTYFYLAYVGA